VIGDAAEKIVAFPAVIGDIVNFYGLGKFDQSS
jgi:hypothetical protein